MVYTLYLCGALSAVALGATPFVTQGQPLSASGTDALYVAEPLEQFGTVGGKLHHLHRPRRPGVFS